MQRALRPAAGATVAALAVACSAGATGTRTGTPATTTRPTTTRPTDAGTRAPSPSAAPVVRTGPTGAAVTLAFGGDVHFEGSVRRRLLASPDTALEPVASLLRSADLAMVNLETPVSDRGSPSPKQFVFRAPRTAFTALRAAGVDVVSIANNHGEDYGLVSLQDTLAGGRAAGIAVVGAGSDETSAFTPYVAHLHGQRIAVIGATQVLDDFAISLWAAGPGKPGLASAKHEQVLLAAVRRARTGNDTVVVYLHWGKELQACPTEPQRELARKLAEAGADVVVGSHAHVLLGSGYLGSTYVDYGLGNFLFYAKGGGPSSRSGVLRLTVRGHAVTAAHWSPAALSGGRTAPLAGAAAVRAASSHAEQRGCTGLSASP